MKEAMFYRKDGKKVHCELCPWKCTIDEGKIGVCGVRKNMEGKLVSLVYGKLSAINVDPIEKKPLYHFYPGEKTLSIATVGCNLSCSFCQNWSSSKDFGNEKGIEEHSEKATPEDVVRMCKENSAKIISFTYTEPTIFFEYMLDIAKLARKKGLKCVLVSNGYIEEEPLRMLCKYIDAANIDLKGFSNEFYVKECKGKLEPVLRSLKILKQENVWLEVTNLLIPETNDDLSQVDELAKWIKENLGRETPLHLSRFHPDYKKKDATATPLQTLRNALKICTKHLDFVYLGNVPSEVSTHCPACKAELIVRDRFKVLDSAMVSENCPHCNFPVPGHWKM